MKDEYVGRVYGRLTVLSVFNDGKYWRAECQCSCGNKCSPALNDVKKSHRSTRSCGCIALEVSLKVHTKHGHYGKNNPMGSPELKAWLSMKSRCYRPADASYSHYGARGIFVCEEWRNSFANFLKDMGHKPTRKHSLDRIDTNKGYSPENCRWATSIIQCNNKTNNVFYLFNGEQRTLAQISRESGISFECLKNRIKNGGLTAEEAVNHSFGSKLQRPFGDS